MKNHTRENIAGMEGYVPGEQPKDRTYIKLNANENAYPPSPRVGEALAAFAANRLRVYPDPVANELRREAARLADLPDENWVICGNGSDDLLTIGVRTFVDQGGAIASFDPSYSLYPVLADIQGADCVLIPLTAEFEMPPDCLEQAAGASVLFIVRPNAPTANSFPMAEVRTICQGFDGVVWIDEAYADFAEDNCLGLVKEFSNVVVSRTFSKSYAMAGIRLGLAFAHPAMIEQMLKVRDSYNVGMLPQIAGLAALRDQGYMAEMTGKIKKNRAWLSDQLTALGVTVFPSQANFIFCQPPLPARDYVQAMREEGVLIRYFSAERTRQYVRITIGDDQECQAVVAATTRILNRKKSDDD
ncbi:MAG: histidinol-phosphate transaminase [Lentisphaeria bacterium]|nr:histidinol-phosphate transaminase [Lentisphaeria bacterium]